MNVEGGGEQKIREDEAPAEPRTISDAVKRTGSAGASPSQSMNDFAVRKHPVHGIQETKDGPTIIFLTVCTQNRERWLATEENHRLLISIWNDASAWVVGRYVLMPDHLHLFAAVGKTYRPLENWVRYWKSMFTKRSGGRDAFSGRWQSDHWDTRLRSWQSYDQKWEYAKNNPVRHGLVSHSEDWPFQGEVYRLSWD